MSISAELSIRQRTTRENDVNVVHRANGRCQFLPIKPICSLNPSCGLVRTIISYLTQEFVLQPISVVAMASILRSLNPFEPKVQASTKIAQLRIYPIKSCRGIQVRNSSLTTCGLELDRRWMFVSAETHKFVTIRDISELTLIDTALTSSSGPTDSDSSEDLKLIISIRNCPDKRVEIPARPTTEWLKTNTRLLPVEIWGGETDGYVYDESVNSIFSDLVKKPIQLVYKGPTPRILRGNGAPEVLGREQSTNFPDVLPLQIANEASMIELNSRLKAEGHDEITIERFRPNIVVRGGDADGMPAWSEDNWKTVRVITGSDSLSSNSIPLPGLPKLDIDVQARCARCQVPNVEPQTAVKDKHQPWDMLVSYRRVDEGIKWKPCFGMLSAPRNEGNIRVGMEFQVLETTQNHLYIKGF